MPVNIGMARLSDHLLLLTVVIYSLAMLAYAGELAYGRRRARATVTRREPELALAGSAARRSGQATPAGSAGSAGIPGMAGAGDSGGRTSSGTPGAASGGTASGAVHATTSELMTAADVDEVAKRRATYRAPGA